MSEIITKEGMPCVEDKDNQLTDGLPAESYITKQSNEDMDKMM